jgi:outer membrane protein assembly factor BamB
LPTLFEKVDTMTYRSHASCLRQKMTMALVAGAAMALASVALCSDWPQWLGPERSGVSSETGLLKSWPEGGPKLIWKASGLGEAHSTPSVAAGKVYGMGLRASDEVIWCLDDRTGKEVWATKIADGITLDAGQGGYGPRSTPTVEGNRLYALGVGGELACLDSMTGRKMWQHSFTKEFGGHVPQWGYSESPLALDNAVVAAPGGRNASIVAFNKTTGEVTWKCVVPEGDTAHYASAILANVNGQKQIIHFLSGGVIGVNPGNGKFLWRYDRPANRTANCSAPIYRDGYVFASSFYGAGGGLAKLNTTASGTTAEEVYATKRMSNHHGGMVLVGDYLYGADNANLTCMNWKTGEVKWADRGIGKCSVTCADGMLYCRSDNGPIALVQATPDGYKEVSRFDQPGRSRAPAWPHPVIANGKLYIRDMDTLLCYDIKAK